MPDWDSDVLQKAESLENPRPSGSLPFSGIYLLWSKAKQSQTWLSEQGLCEKKISCTPTAAFQAFRLRHLLSWFCEAAQPGNAVMLLLLGNEEQHYPPLLIPLKFSSVVLYTQGSNRAEQLIPLKMREHPRMLSSTTLQSCRIYVSGAFPAFT